MFLIAPLSKAFLACHMPLNSSRTDARVEEATGGVVAGTSGIAAFLFSSFAAVAASVEAAADAAVGPDVPLPTVEEVSLF